MKDFCLFDPSGVLWRIGQNTDSKAIGAGTFHSADLTRGNVTRGTRHMQQKCLQFADELQANEEVAGAARRTL